MNYILSLVYLLFINIINENRGCARTPILPLSVDLLLVTFDPAYLGHP